MARKPALNSDFAQKLLGDIRERKERLGYTSSGQRSSNASSSFNAEANSRRSFQGARQTTKNNFHPQNSSNNGLPCPRTKTKQPTLNASSQEIVPYKKARTASMDNADMSMALALALSNTGKLQNIEVLSRTKVGTEFVTHRGSIHFSSPNSRLNGKASNRNEFLFLPNFGVQKINEMISAYTNGRKQRRSLAMELEESLNMLMMLQDASDYMGISNKNKVLLLKDKEETEKGFRSKSTKQNKSNSDKKSLSSYQRSMNSGTSVNTKKGNHLSANTSSSNFKNSNNSNPTRENSAHGKLRMPSVIARLMGLEDLPEHAKPKVEIKEVEPQGKEEKSEEHTERCRKKENDMSACQVEFKEETRLERITRTYIDSKKGIFGKCAINAQNILPKKNDEKVHIIRNQKKKEKPNHEVVKQKTVIAPMKGLQKIPCIDKDLMEKQSIGDARPGKAVNSNLVNKKKEVDGSMRGTKNKKVFERGCKIVDKHVHKEKNLMELRKEKGREAGVEIVDLEEVLEKGCKIVDKHVQKDKNLMELRNENGRETGVEIANLEEDDMRKDSSKCSEVVLDHSSNEEKNYNEITGMNLDSRKGPENSVFGQELLQLQKDEQTDSGNYTKGSMNFYREDSLTENQILLKEVFLGDPEFLGLSQALFTSEVTIVELEKNTKTPLEKENNKVLLHTAHEVLKRKASRLDTCENIKNQSLNSLIRELDSDIRSLAYGGNSENIDFQKIIEREIGDGNPDSNCMWEYGWNTKHVAPFEKCEVVKEMEKHLTSGLITELTRDLVDEIIIV